MKVKEYKYINYDGIICRYPYLPKEKNYSVIGDIYDPKSKSWLFSTDTMKMEISGVGDELTKSEVSSLLR